MLCMSFSSTDIVGHAFGPYSVELEDMYLRLDKEIARLIKYLEKTVGKNEFTMFLTADHAILPVPQFLIDNKLPGGYTFVKDVYYELQANVAKKFGAELVIKFNNNSIYIDHDKANELEISLKEVNAYVSSEVQKWDHVKRAYTHEELYDGRSDDEWMDMVRRGYYPPESGDVLMILHPGYLVKLEDEPDARKGTGHGAVFNYDTHVPLLWYGKNIPAQEIHRSLNITDITATLTQLLYIQTPNAVTGKPILEILEKD